MRSVDWVSEIHVRVQISVGAHNTGMYVRSEYRRPSLYNGMCRGKGIDDRYGQ